MLIREIVLRESYAEELEDVVKDLLVSVMSKDQNEIPTEKFRSLLSKQGYSMSMDELISAIDASGYVNSVDAEKIVPSDAMGDVSTAGMLPDVGDMATGQAMDDIKDEL